MKLLLINPTAQQWRMNAQHAPSPHTQAFRFSMLSSLYVAAAVPPDVQVEILDEEIEPLNFDTEADLIGISFMTFNAPHAYEIADKFRNEKRKKVIVGGYHPTFMPEEALQHADAVCIGEAEKNVPAMITDLKTGSLKKIYNNGLADLRGLPVPNRSLIKKQSYAFVEAVQATRGCPNRCKFCSISPFFNHQFRFRPIQEVIDELAALGKYLLFMDDNIIANREYAKELFIKIKPLGKKWFSQCNIQIAADEELLQLASASGCIGLFIGLESLQQANLAGWGKNFCRADEYLQAIKKIHRAKIGLVAGIVFGYDEDREPIFDQTLRFLHEANIDALQATILTPFPGTPLFEEMNAQDRIVSRDWSQYDFSHVVFEPLNMDAKKLKAGHDRVLKEFYAWKSVIPRICREFAYLHPSTIMKAATPLNVSYRHRLRADGTFANPCG